MNRGDLKNARKIVERIVIEGDLMLETPTRFGNGDRDGLVDMTIARDPLTGQPLLPGASIGGALRSYLRTRESGFRQPDAPATMERLLFGFEDGKGGSQSYLVTYDSLCQTMMTELRDGVAIDPKTRTARDQKKYDLELLAAGSTFPLRLELLVGAGQEAALLQALAVALQGFERGEIPMGARRRRGFGKCSVQGWRMRRYNLTQPVDLVAWLQDGRTADATKSKPQPIAQLLETVAPTLDERSTFAVEAWFGLMGSLLIRSSTEIPGAPDMVHLHSKRDGVDQPIVSGTSLAGALRARALRIAKTIGEDEAANSYINELFGPQIEGSNDIPQASRLWVAESVIQNPQELVVNRVKIDRFTGGSFPTALFSQQPIFGTTETAIQLQLQVQNPQDADKGLLLLLLKDLWTEDLPLGGEASVGRGRLCGKCASMASGSPTNIRKAEQQAKENADVSTADTAGTADDVVIWQIQQDGGQLRIQGDRGVMQHCVDALWAKVQGGPR